MTLSLGNNDEDVEMVDRGADSLVGIEARATSPPHARYSALKLKLKHGIIRIIYYIKLLKFLINKTLKITKLNHLYFIVINFLIFNVKLLYYY